MIAIGSGVLLILSGHFAKPVAKPPALNKVETNVTAIPTPNLKLIPTAANKITTVPTTYRNYGWYTHNGQNMQFVNGKWYTVPQQNVNIQTPTDTPIPIYIPPVVLSSSTPIPTILMPNNPYIDSLCDNLGNCVHSQYADKQSSSYQNPFPTIHVGNTLIFTVKVLNPQNEPILAAFLPYSGKGGQSWSNNLTYTKTFTDDDINTSQYYINVYIKSQSGNIYRLSSCYNGPCDDYTGLSYIVLP